MTASAYRYRWAEEEIARIIATLPEALRPLAEALPVILAEYPGEDAPGPDLLGLFDGYSYDEAVSAADPTLTRIELYLGNIWEMVERNPAEFVHEVGITYLHELGHYFGWDEAELEERGLE